jgi:hypothetical protein
MRLPGFRQVDRALGGRRQRRLVDLERRDLSAQDRVFEAALPREGAATCPSGRPTPRSPMPEIIARSCCSRYFATSQPRLTVPTTLAFGTRTLSKNVSQNGDRPEINRIDFVDTPFEAMSNRIKLMPSCFLADGSVRTRQKIQSA